MKFKEHMRQVQGAGNYPEYLWIEIKNPDTEAYSFKIASKFVFKHNGNGRYRYIKAQHVNGEWIDMGASQPLQSYKFLINSFDPNDVEIIKFKNKKELEDHMVLDSI